MESNDRHSEIMSSLKECFRGTINSMRRFEQISSIGQLLKVLELRDLLSEDSVECLKSIALKLPNSQHVLQKITDYERNYLPREYGDYYSYDVLFSIYLTAQTVLPLIASSLKQDFYVTGHRKEPEDNFITSSPLSSLTKRKRQRIIDTIVQEIGSYWRDLARYLKICEDIIQDIDIQYKTLDEKVRKLMEATYIAEPQRWFFLLCDALESNQRRDLVRSLKDIMVMNI